MTNIKITFPYEPKPKLRPRFRIMYGRIATITPPETKQFEYLISEYYCFNAQHYCFEKGVPLSIELEFGMPIPASATKKSKIDMQAGIVLPAKKPDIDNLTKSVLDALNGVAWHDDAQIVEIKASKIYSGSPYIKMFLHDF